MEPIQSTQGTDGADAPDAGAQIAEATETIAGQLGGEPQDEAPFQPERPAPPAGPSRKDLYTKLQTGARGRVQRDRMRRGEFNQLRTEYDSRLAQNNALLQQALEVLKSRGQIAQEEEIPDMALDPAAFGKWLDTKSKGNVQEALKPILEAIQKQEERFAAIEQRHAQEAAQERQVQERTAQWQGWEAAYNEASPELAAGSHDRFEGFRGIFQEALAEAGHLPELADMIFAAIGAGAEAAGENPVASIDQVIVALVTRLTGQVPIGLDGGNGAAAAGNGNGNGHHPPAVPPPSEIDRLNAVRERTAAAGNAGPRLAGRQPQNQSPTRDLWASGIQNQPGGMAKIKAAALQETGGDGAAAALLINSLE